MLVIDKESKVTLYEQIYNQLREQIIMGTIPENSMLPSTRSLAKELQVSRNTVESAYLQLYSEGYISSKACSGYKVEKIDSDLLRRLDPILMNEKNQPLQEMNEQGVSHTKEIAFQYGKLRFSDFPLRLFRKITNQILLSPDIDLISVYNNRKGELDLRIEIMKYLYESRGVRCKPEQIIISSGMSVSLGLLSQLLMGHTNKIAVEDPCYDTVRLIFKNHGFHFVPVQVEKDGINLADLSHSSAKAVYVTPSHQFPTGVVLPVNKRLSLIEWADRNEVFIIEDDYDSDLRYNSRPIPSMQSLDSKGRVVYINTFSKSFAPGLRLSFMVLPMTLLEEYQLHFNRYNCTVPWLEQKIMYEFMKEGHWNRHLRKICFSNKKRHDILVNTIIELMGNNVTIHGKNAGLHIILEVHNGLTESQLIEKADAAGVKVYPVSCYYANYHENTNNRVLIGFGSLSAEDIVVGIHQLKSAWF
ncbi:MAG: PLP-dependent aminotransferase family protein [Bacillota bacterium]